ncbi:MAG: hypothetical protein ISS45_09895 [Candidatus Omnitrophica bacterium]|nr:hypothetical protein [Candidatus Omnitrophota bacterium]
MLKKILEIKKFFAKGKKVGFAGQANLTCLAYRDANFYIAHCLEFDIVAQGSTEEEAKKELADLILEQIKFAVEKDIEDTSLFHPAPKKYWDDIRYIKSKRLREEFLKTPPKSESEIINRLDWIPAHAHQ